MENNSINISSTSTSLFSNLEEVLESFKFIESDDGNFIEVIKRFNTPIVYTTSTIVEQNQDYVIKEIYGISTDSSGEKKLELLKTIKGTVKPGYYVEESFDFEN